MSTCKNWTNKVVTTCKNWATKIDYECTEWADEGSYECTEWADEGSNECSEWKDEGYNECSEWGEKCGWQFWNCVIEIFCKGWYWVANMVCQAWYWVANMVCQAWFWIVKLVCKVFTWIVKAVCVIFSWFVLAFCVLWDIVKCGVIALVLVVSRRNKKTLPIEHLFVLMLENQSYDHMLGFSDLVGIDAKTGVATTANGLNPEIHTNIDPRDGGVVAVSSPDVYSLKNVDEDPGHEFYDTITQLCGKKPNGNIKDYPDPTTGGYPPIDNSGFIMNYNDIGAINPKRIMRNYSPEQLPILNQLAKEFAVCDNWFSSMPGPTFPNRFFLHAATSGGLDDSPSNVDIVTATTVEGFRFENGTIFDALDDHCLKWEIFEGDQFPVSFTLNGMSLNALQGKFTDFDEFKEHVDKVNFDKKFIFIEPKYGKHDFSALGPGDFTCGNSMHPLDDVTRGEKLIKEVYETIRNSPHWEKSMLLIVLDEHGGFYDHVAPPSAVPPGDLVDIGNNHNKFKFDRLGVRVPAIVVSPLIKKGVIDHTVYDHTSFLATMERLFGMKNLTERDKAANDFLHLFSLTSARTDTPSQLNEVANSGFQCEDDDEDEVKLTSNRELLLQSIKSGIHNEKPISEIKVAHSQIGFNYVALLKVLQTAKYPDNEQWIANFKNIKTGIDAALFMTEAKLKLRFGIDVNEKLRKDEKQKYRIKKHQERIKRHQEKIKSKL